MNIFHFSQQGKRPYQEDSFLIDDSYHKIFIVCDGVGGSSGGSLASQSTVDYFKGVFESQVSHNFNDEEIVNLYNGAQENLLDVVNRNPGNEGMATTAVIACFTPSETIISHLGDSRAYVLLRSSNAYWRSKNHSLVQELFDAGILKSEYDMQSHPMKNRITSAITSSTKSEITKPSITRFDRLDPGDIIMLCSDGVLEAFPNDEFIGLLFDPNLPFEEKAHKIQEECAKISKDNNTCIIVELEPGEAYMSGSNRGVDFRSISGINIE